MYFSLFFHDEWVCINHRTALKSYSFVSNHCSHGFHEMQVLVELCRGCRHNGNKAIEDKKKTTKQTDQKKKSEISVLQTQRAPHGKQTSPLISVSLQSRLHRFVNSTRAGRGWGGDIMVMFCSQSTTVMTFESQSKQKFQKAELQKGCQMF